MIRKRILGDESELQRWENEGGCLDTRRFPRGHELERDRAALASHRSVNGHAAVLDRSRCVAQA